MMEANFTPTDIIFSGQIKMTTKVYDPITKKYVKRKPIKIKMGGGAHKTLDKKLIDTLLTYKEII